MTLCYHFIGGSVPVTARENSPMVHLCGLDVISLFYGFITTSVFNFVYGYNIHVCHVHVA